jgi:FkbM family methyltransferase
MRLKAILKPMRSLTVYFSMPPYNIQWLRSFDFAKEFLLLNPITIIDIGSRDGSCDELAGIKKFSDYIGFDADADSVEKDTLSGNLSWRSSRIISKYIGPEKGTTSFNLYVRKSESSALNPSPTYQANFSRRLRIESQVRVESDTLSNVLVENRLLPDLIKIDTQGTEYDIIDSSREIFSDSLIVEVEAEFLEMYENQKLFPDVCKLMYQLGHQLLYVNRVFGNMNTEIVVTRGSLIFGDFLFGLNFERAMSLSIERKMKYCLLLINYGHIDFAFQLYVSDKNFRAQHPELENVFRSHFKRPIRSKIVKAFISQFDKIAFIYLAIRKTNGLHFDSDRSWPIR